MLTHQAPDICSSVIPDHIWLLSVCFPTVPYYLGVVFFAVQAEILLLHVILSASQPKNIKAFVNHVLYNISILYNTGFTKLYKFHSIMIYEFVAGYLSDTRS